MSNKTNKALAETLGMEVKSTEVEVLSPVPEIEPSGNSHQEEDYNLSRNTFRDLIRKGNSAMEDMVSLARESESPRAYEVLATMMKTIADTTKDLYDLQKKTKELKDENKKSIGEGNVTVERAVFVGSTADLLKRVKENKE